MKQGIPEGGAPQGAQKSVIDAKPTPQQQADPEPVGGHRRGGHPSRRLSQPPVRRGSS